MQVGYSGTTGDTPRYICGRNKQLYGGERGCQSVGGRRLENRVLDEVFAMLEPASLAATAKALAEADANHRRHVAVFELAVERARFDAERARRQFDAVEPENRLVARTLERSLEAALVAQRQAEANLATQRLRQPTRLTDEETAWLARAGADVRAVFHAPTTTWRERKLLLRAVISEVVITVAEPARRAEVNIVWEGGAATGFGLDLNKTGKHFRTTDEDTVDLVRRLAQRYNDKTIAAVLSKTRPAHRHRPGVHPNQSEDPQSLPGHPCLSSHPKRSHPPAMMSSWSPSPAPRNCSACHGSRCIAGSTTGSSTASNSHPEAHGTSASPTTSGVASWATSLTAGSTSIKQPRSSAWPARRCYTRSNAATSKPSTSTAGAEKAYEST